MADSSSSLIDVSAEDDSLISVGNDNGDEDYFQLPKDDVDVGKSKQQETSSNLLRKSGKCNLRKSLAWDTAFFTSDGVLDPEELSIINSGLTSIEEDIRKSADSSTSSLLTDDSFTLFQDVRASITNSNSNSVSVSVAATHSSANMDCASRTKPIIASKVGLQRTNKEADSTKPKMESAGKKKSTSLCHPRAQVAGKSGELNLSTLRPPKIVGRINPSSTSPIKRATLGASGVKNDISTRKVAIGRKENVGGSSRHVIGDSNATLRSTPSPRSSSSSSVSGTKLESAASCSSHNRSGSTSSDSTEKSPHKSLRKKTTCRNFNSAPNIKPPLRISSIKKSEVGNPHPPVHHIDYSKRSSDISPASSLDGWSSESSSSTSASQHSVKVIDISSHEGLYSQSGTFQIDMRKHHRNQLCVEQKKSSLPNPFSKVSISGNGSLPRPAAADVSRNSKPTGLRMPSPKFGYFDTEKSAEPSPTGFQFHPGVRSALPKHGAGVGNIHGKTVRAKAGKLQPARNMTGKSSMIFDSNLRAPQCTSKSRPTGESQELLNASPCVATTKVTRRPLDSPQRIAPKTTQVICPSITSIPQDDNLYGGSHLEAGALGSSLYEGDSGGQNPFMNDDNTTSEQVSATKTTEGCYGISSKQLKDGCHGHCVENLKTVDVGELTNTGRDCINIYMNEGADDGQDTAVFDIGLNCKKVSVTKVTKEDSESNDLLKKSGSESPMRNENMREVTETESKELSLKGDDRSQDSFVKPLLIPPVENIFKHQLSGRLGTDVKVASSEAVMHDLGPLESNLDPCHDINEKENSLFFDNQADGLSKQKSCIDSYVEELAGKNDSSYSKFDGQMYSPDTSAINSREVVVHDQEVISKSISHPLSTNGMDILPRTRTPLAVKAFLCNEPATSEYASESTMEKVSTDSGQTNN